MKKYIITLILLSLSISHSYSQDESTKSLGISPALVYDSEYSLFFVPKITYTHNLNVFEVGLNLPVQFDLDFQGQYISVYNTDISYVDDKMGIYLGYKRLIPLQNSKNHLYWNISLLNYQRNYWTNTGAADNPSSIFNDNINLYHQVMTGLGAQFMLFNNLYFFGDLNFGIENVRLKSNEVNYPSFEISEEGKFSNENTIARMSIQFGFKYNFLNL